MPLTAALLAVTPIVAMSGVETPVSVVRRLLEAGAEEDWPTVLAMLTADAMFGIGDVGAPLNKESVSTLSALEKYGCRIISMREKPSKPPIKGNTLFVEVKRSCPYGAVSGKSGEHELTTTYFVIGKKVAGYYTEMNLAPKP
jgi:hypothetical protein